jgi:hypothetical protein
MRAPREGKIQRLIVGGLAVSSELAIHQIIPISLRLDKGLR